jgi:CRP-like cAMP-binding protein
MRRIVKSAARTLTEVDENYRFSGLRFILSRHLPEQPDTLPRSRQPKRDVFSEMARLDPEPRLASVTAVEPTRLFRLAQAPFYELMADRPEVATGIIRVLTGHLRARVRDLARLDARAKELEQATHPLSA